MATTDSPTPDGVRSATFVLQSRYESQVVADGVAFPAPRERVIVNWHTNGGVEVLDDIETLYDKLGDDPVVLWKQEDGSYSEAEPAPVTETR